MEPVVVNGTRWFTLGINPEPWAVGPAGVSRTNGKLAPFIGRNQQLAAFQEAVRDELGADHIMLDGPVSVRFYFWRRRSDYTTPQARRHRKHDADVTNLQKATEDALQKILFENDKQVVHVESHIMDQGPDVVGKIVIALTAGENALAEAIGRIPLEVQDQMELLDVVGVESGDDLGWGENSPSLF